MKSLIKSIAAMALLFMSSTSHAQLPEPSAHPKLIAVVNKANWCSVCKANGSRFGAVLMPYASKGLNIYMNDISDETTKAASRLELEKANVYEAVYTIPRQGLGKMLKACGLVKDKKQTQDVAGIVTFVDPKTHRQLKQLSLAEPDEVMEKTITDLLN